MMNLIFACCVLFTVSAKNVVNNVINDKLLVSTERAQCTIKAGDVQASAEATVTKTLEGVCSSDEMKLIFANLELKLLSELQAIKQLLKNAESAKISIDPLIPKTNIPLPADLMPFSHITTTYSTIKSKTEKYDHDYNDDNDTDDEAMNMEVLHLMRPKILAKKNFIPSDRPQSTRDAEVKKLNNTMLSGAETKLFAYYWKLDKFTLKLKSNVSVDYSPVFTILGKRLRLKAVFNRLNRDFLYLLLESVNVNVKEDFHSVFLETGSIFKQIQSKIQFKHKIAVLDQVNPMNMPNDLESQEFISTEIGFSIPNSALLSTAYLKNDTILIKLIVYL